MPSTFMIPSKASIGVSTTSTPARSLRVPPGSRRSTIGRPDFVEDRISSFFNNLSEFRNGLNGALQGRADVAGTALSRLLVNSTVGIVGLFDVATGFGIPEHEEDFGQTLGRWGMRSGPYIVLPILGPSNLRDAGGFAADTAATNFLPVNAGHQ